MCGQKSKRGLRSVKSFSLVLLLVLALFSVMPSLIANETTNENENIDYWLSRFENANQNLTDSSKIMLTSINSLDSDLLSLDNRVMSIENTLLSWSESMQSLSQLGDSFQLTWSKQETTSQMLMEISTKYEQNNSELKLWQENTSASLTDFEKRLSVESEKTNALGEMLATVDSLLDTVITALKWYIVWDIFRTFAPVIIDALEFVDDGA